MGLLEIEKFDFLNLDVQITKPLVNVSHVLLLDVLELVGVKIYTSV